MEDLAGGAEDKRKWVSLDEAVSMLGLTRGFVLRASKERGYIRRQAHRSASPFFLRQEIESWVDFRSLGRQWKRNHPISASAPRYTEKIDIELARRLFIGAKAAAEILGVSTNTLAGMVYNGRLVSYQTAPGHRGSRLWFSRRAVMQLAEDPERQRRRANYWKGREAGGVKDRGPQMARTVKEGIPKGWLTAREAAERLGVCPHRVHALRRSGMVRGEQIWRRNKPLKFWYYPDYEVERVISLREQVKELAGPNPPAPFPNTFAALTGKGEKLPSASAPASGGGQKETPFVPSPSPFRLDADGPEPKWACDDVDLTRFFYLQGKSEY